VMLTQNPALVRPSAQPAWARMIHDVSPRHRLVRLAPTADGCYGTSGSVEPTVAGIFLINAQFKGDIRGVPPRGRPV
jgi:hypothetical protein